MRYIVVESFGENAKEIYRRAEKRGRLLPPGLAYVDSWVSADLKRCFQLMECEDRRLLDEWMSRWRDLCDFEVYPVISSEEASRAQRDASSED